MSERSLSSFLEADCFRHGSYDPIANPRCPECLKEEANRLCGAPHHTIGGIACERTKGHDGSHAAPLGWHEDAGEYEVETWEAS